MSIPSLKNLENIHIQDFQDDLIQWFKKSHRQLPWRINRDPYRIWVSEIMLQQTKVDTVIPYFENFMKSFPTIEAFAEASEDSVLKAWEGLGYYSRVRNLHTAAKEVVNMHAGKVPHTLDVLLQLKGIGPYTAGAILSIAYGVPAPAVDGNVMRVLSRILIIPDDIAKPATRKIFETAVKQLISHEEPSAFNQGLMELGALICTPTSPACLLCPVRVHCHAYHQGIEMQLPVKSKKKQPKTVPLIAGILRNEEGKILIRKRENKGLLANLWEFPNCERPNQYMPSHFILTDYLENTHKIVSLVQPSLLTEVKHVFTHLIWNIHVHVGELKSVVEETTHLKLVSEDEISAYAFPVAHQKMWDSYIEMNTKVKKS